LENLLANYIMTLQRDEAVRAVNLSLKHGENPLTILEQCRQGMADVGERFQEGEYFLSELLLSADLFKELMVLLEPHLAAERRHEILGKVVLATMHGDIHDLGKSIVATMLRVHAFEVHDLGVDVQPEELVKKIREIDPDIVGLSSLITTSFHSSKRASEMLRETGLRDRFKLVVGGGVTTPAFKEYVGADFQTLDVAEGVAYCIEAVRGRV